MYFCMQSNLFMDMDFWGSEVSADEKYMMEALKEAQKAGLVVNVWTVNKEDQIRWCIENGVDIITTDDPALVNKLIKEMCK